MGKGMNIAREVLRDVVETSWLADSGKLFNLDIPIGEFMSLDWGAWLGRLPVGRRIGAKDCGCCSSLIFPVFSKSPMI